MFGITGVGSADLINYSYWCIEKGYARYTGQRDETPAWLSRARGWIRVMGADVIFSASVYTFATVAFYLLGAGILHGLGVVPEGTEMVAPSRTSTPRRWELVELPFPRRRHRCSVFVVVRGNGCRRQSYADFVRVLGGYDRHDAAARFRYIRIFSAVLLLIPVLYYVLLREPVLMVKIGGIAKP